MSNSASFVLSQLASDPQAFNAQVLSEMERRGLVSDPRAYEQDPVGFCERILGHTYTQDVKKMMTSVRDHAVTVAISANGVGKTYGAAHVAMWWYLTRTDAQVYTAAAPPEENLKRLLWGELGAVVEKHPDLFVGHESQALQIRRSARSFLCGVTIPATGDERQREAKFSGKHAPHLLFIFDEGDAIPDEVYRGAESCMSGGESRMLIMFNPRRPAGAVYRMMRDGLAHVVHLGAFDHPNVVSGEDTIPGAVTRAVTARRIVEWTAPLSEDVVPDGQSFEVPSFLEGVVAHAQSGRAYPPLELGWRQVVNPAFSYMVLGRYPGQSANALIADEWIAAARSRWDVHVAEYGLGPREGLRPTLGLDVAELGSDSNVLVVRYGGWVEPLVDWSGVDPLETARRAGALYETTQALRIHVDATGVGAGAYAELVRQGCRASRVMVASAATQTAEEGVFDRQRDQLFWALREWLRTDTGAMLPPDEALLEELRVIQYEVKNGRIKVQSKEGAHGLSALLGRSPDRMDALAMTFYEEGGAFDGYDLS